MSQTSILVAGPQPPTAFQNYYRDWYDCSVATSWQETAGKVVVWIASFLTVLPALILGVWGGWDRFCNRSNAAPAPQTLPQTLSPNERRARANDAAAQAAANNAIRNAQASATDNWWAATVAGLSPQERVAMRDSLNPVMLTYLTSEQRRALLNSWTPGERANLAPGMLEALEQRRHSGDDTTILSHEFDDAPSISIARARAEAARAWWAEVQARPGISPELRAAAADAQSRCAALYGAGPGSN